MIGFITGFTVGESNMLFHRICNRIFTFIGYKLLNEIPTLCAALANSVHVGSLLQRALKKHNIIVRLVVVVAAVDSQIFRRLEVEKDLRQRGNIHSAI
ncbi:hypothetical protein [Enterobacter cloacae]|uniref:hypothetical protein n=1 Tax=Enterobacter cloacae TaxID=550 RepID=UPI00388F8DA5